MIPLELILSEIPDFGKCRSLRSRERVGGCGDSLSPNSFSSPQPPPLLLYIISFVVSGKQKFLQEVLQDFYKGLTK